MDAIPTQLQQLVKTFSNENPKAEVEGSGSRNKNKKDNNHTDKEDESVFHINEEYDKIKDKVLEDIQTKLNALTHKETIQKVGIICPYPLEWDLIPFLDNYHALTIDKYYRKGSPNQRIFISIL